MYNLANSGKLVDNSKNVLSANETNNSIQETLNNIDTATSIIGNIAGPVVDYVTTKETNKANKELWELQADRNEKYNSPSALRERLLAAGYSPLLGQVGTPVVQDSADPTQQKNNVGSQLSAMALNTPNMITARADAALKNEEEKGVKIENENKQNKIDAELRATYKKMQLDDAQISNLSASNSKMHAEIDALNRTQDREDFIARSNKEFQDWQKKNGEEKTKIDWYNAKVNEALADSQIGLNVQEQEALRAKIVETMQHVELMAQQGENIEADTISREMDNFIRQLVFTDEAAAANDNAENARKLAKTRNNAFVRAVEWTSQTFGSLLGGVGAAAVVASSKTGSPSRNKIGF